MSIPDSLHNLQIVQKFCANVLPVNPFHFTYEDILYTHDSLRPNIMVFLAELFAAMEGAGM